MGLSRLEYPYTGGPRTFAVNFALGYLNKEDVQVYVQGELDALGDQIFRAFTWNGDAEVQVTDAIAVDTVVIVVRTVARDQLVLDVSGTASFTRATLVRGFKQVMMTVHEFLDGRIAAYDGISSVQDFLVRMGVQVGRATDQADIATAAASNIASQVGDASASATSSANSAASATASATTATLRASEITASAATAAAQASTATSSASAAGASASTATTQAGAAATSAGTSTTKAGVATAQAVIATDKATVATTKAAEAAASAISATGSASTATAQAGTATTKATEAGVSAAEAAASAATMTPTPELTPAQAISPASGAFGKVSGNLLAQAAKANLNAAGIAPIYACRAWVNFNGTGTVAIRASGNVSSITDNGQGDYTINFATALPDADYAMTGMCKSGDGNAGRGPVDIHPTALPTVSACRIMTLAVQNVASQRDSPMVTVAIFR
jgi:hypothetical protein